MQQCVETFDEYGRLYEGHVGHSVKLVKILVMFLQGTVRGVHEPLCELCVQSGQPRPVRGRRPVAGHALGGATEAAGSGAAVWSLQGGPGSHEVAETLLQVSGDQTEKIPWGDSYRVMKLYPL